MDQGWAFPAGRRPSAHYFNSEKVSLCGAWGSAGLTIFDPLEDALVPHSDDCKRCRRQLEARGVKKA